MAQRRPLASHPAFAPLIALWLGLLLGLVALVVPIEWLAWTPELPGVPMRTSAAVMGAIAGMAAGFLLARLWVARTRPTPDRSLPAPRTVPDDVRRPLHIREEVAPHFETAPDILANEPELPLPTSAYETDRSPFSLTDSPGDDTLARMVDRFDRALDAYARRVADRKEFGPDAVQRFVEIQTGAPTADPATPGPDHQAELRKALDKLARLHGRG